MKELAGKAAIVTGGASGIGLAIVQRFVEQGADVLAVDVRASALDKALASVGGAKAYAADLADPDAASAIVGVANEQLGKCDVLVNCAAQRDYFATALNTSLELWNSLFAVNVTAPFLLSKEVVPGMIERGRGVIVNIASIAAFRGGKGGTAYTVTKHAILGLTRALAVQYGPAGVRSVAVAPGGILTPGRSSLRKPDAKGIGPDPAGTEILARTSEARLRRGTADEIADVVAFLASDRADLINGTCIVADASWTTH